jgi:hypothetical protein
MHWAPIPVSEFALPAADCDIADEDIYRLLSRAPRRGFWLTALLLVVLISFGFVACASENPLAGVLFIVLGTFAGTGHILIRDKLNAALWIAREPAAVYWAEPGNPNQQLFAAFYGVHVLTLHTPAPVRLDALVTSGELFTVLHWIRRRNPDALIGNFSPHDSDGRLLGTDPWSPCNISNASKDPIQGQQSRITDDSVGLICGLVRCVAQVAVQPRSTRGIFGNQPSFLVVPSASLPAIACGTVDWSK